MRNTHEENHFHENGRQTAFSFTGNETPIGIPQVYLKLMTFILTYEWLLTKIPSTVKLKYYLQNLRIFTGKNIATNFKIKRLNFKILFLPDTNQT